MPYGYIHESTVAPVETREEKETESEPAERPEKSAPPPGPVALVFEYQMIMVSDPQSDSDKWNYFFLAGLKF
jgi:hypothetical protein